MTSGKPERVVLGSERTAEAELRDRGVEWDQVRRMTYHGRDPVTGEQGVVTSSVHRFFLRGTEEVAYSADMLDLLMVHPNPIPWGDEKFSRSREDS